MKPPIAIRVLLGVVLLPKKLNNTQKIFAINGYRSGKNIVMYAKAVTVRIMIAAYIADVSSKITPNTKVGIRFNGAYRLLSAVLIAEFVNL